MKKRKMGFMKSIGIVIIFFLFSAGKVMAQVSPVHKQGHDTIKTITTTPEQNAKMSYNKGLEDFSKGDYTTALANFDQAITNNPKFEPAYLNRANTYIRQKDYLKAVTDYKKALELDSNDTKVWYGLGQAQTVLGNKEQAISALTHFTKKNPGNGDGWYCLGELLARTNNYKDALTDFSLAISSKSNFSEAYNDRGTCYYQLANYKAAEEDYRLSLALAKTPEAYNNLGNTQYKNGNYDAAIESFSEAIALRPQYIDAFNNRGVVYLDKKNYQEARNDFNKAIRLDSAYYAAYCNRAIAEYRMNNLDTAKADCDKTIKLKSDYGYAYLNRGIIEELMRHEKDACDDWKMAAQYGVPVANNYTKDCK